MILISMPAVLSGGTGATDRLAEQADAVVVAEVVSASVTSNLFDFVLSVTRASVTSVLAPNDVPIYGSGYTIVHEMDCPPPHGFITIYACSITPSLTGAAVVVGNNLLVSAGATSPSPMSLTQEVQN